jgi:hypothetical protein
MKNEWRKYDPKDQTTHPRENSRVQLKFSDGTQFSGGYLRGHFHHGGAVSAATVNQSKHWRYVD